MTQHQLQQQHHHYDVAQFMPSSLFSEGPTPGALQEMLDSIDKHTEQVRSSLFSNLMSSLAGSADPQVLSAMVALGDVSSSSGTEQWVAQYANQYLEMQQHVAALQAELKAAQAAADLEATEKEFMSFIGNGQYNDAAFSLVQLRKILEDSSSQSGVRDGLSGADLAALQAACAACDTCLEQALASSLSQAFDVDLNSQIINISSTLPSGGDVADVWAAMQLSGSLENHMQSVASVLLSGLLPQLLSGAAYLELHSAAEAAMLRWSPAQPLPDGSYDTSHVESQVMQLLSVLAQSLFRQQPAALAAFGAAFWQPFVGAYEAVFLQQIKGSDANTISARQQAAANMEQQAVSMGLAEPGSELAQCLTRSIQQSYHAAQVQVLAQARDLLMSADPRAEPVVVGQPLPLDADFLTRARDNKAQAWELLDPPSGWDTTGPVLATGYYQISNTALQLVILIDDAMAQACHSGESHMAQSIISAVSKMSLMYSTLVQVPPDNEALALLHHNDLQYIADHLLMAPFLFDPELKHLLGSGLWFGAEALQLRSAARTVLTQLLSAQKSSLHAEMQPLLAQSQALSSSGGSSKAASKRADGKDGGKAARQPVLYTLQRFGRLLWNQLAPGVALEGSQQLVEAVAGEVLTDILHKGDIGEAETEELGSLYSPLLQECVGALLADMDLSSQQGDLQGVDLKQLAADALQNRCPTLKKALGVLQLLQCRLADIVGAWEQGALTADGFTLPEVEGLVKALFEDTDYRAECLQHIEAAAEGA